MLKSGIQIAAAFLTVALICAGCIVNDPPSLPVGVRVDAGVATFLLPLCPGEQLDRAEVTPYATESIPPPDWIGEGFTGDPLGVVALQPDNWEKSQGSYVGLENASYDFDSQKLTVGMVIADLSAKQPPPGKYNVDGKVLTYNEFRHLVKQERGC